MIRDVDIKKESRYRITRHSEEGEESNKGLKGEKFAGLDRRSCPSVFSLLSSFSYSVHHFMACDIKVSVSLVWLLPRFRALGRPRIVNCANFVLSPRVSTSYRPFFKVRTLAGATLDISCDAEDPLTVVYAAVLQKTTESDFLLSTPFPRRVFQTSELDHVTVKAAG